jgi:hypothetical protein
MLSVPINIELKQGISIPAYKLGKDLDHGDSGPQ